MVDGRTELTRLEEMNTVHERQVDAPIDTAGNVREWYSLKNSRVQKNVTNDDHTMTTPLYCCQYTSWMMNSTVIIWIFNILLTSSLQ